MQLSPTSSPVHTATQEITVAAQFLEFLGERGRSPTACRQADPGGPPSTPPWCRCRSRSPTGKLRDSGIHLLGARNSALHELVLEMLPPIVARALGYSAQVTEKD